MRNLLTYLLGVCLITVVGCNQPEGNWSWENSTPIIQNVSTIAARIAFAQPDVLPHQEQMCTISEQIVIVLDNFDDPDATFATVREVALDFIRNLPEDVLNPNAKPITITVVDSVLNTAWIFVQSNYTEFVNQNEAKAAVAVAKAVAKGIQGACVEIQSVDTFSADEFQLTINDK